MFHGRRKPYTEIGITRVPCIRCHKPSIHQWQVCANDNRYVGICHTCDIKLNKLALDFMNIPNKEQLLQRYIELSQPI